MGGEAYDREREIPAMGSELWPDSVYRHAMPRAIAQLKSTLTALAAIFTWASTATADPIVSLLMKPAAAGDPGITVDRAAVRGEHLLSIRFLFDVAQHPLVVVTRGNQPDTVVGSQLWFRSSSQATQSDRVSYCTWTCPCSSTRRRAPTRRPAELPLVRTAPSRSET